MEFKKWLLAQEGYGMAGSDVAANEPNPGDEVVRRAMADTIKGVGAFKTIDTEPLPGNTKGMRKFMRRRMKKK